MIARSPDEVRKLVSTGKWKRKHLEALRRDFGDHALFDALFSAFTQKPPVPYAEQEAPGDYLLELRPRGTENLPSLIRASLAGWNLSIEQLPFHFRETYSIEAVQRALDGLDSESGLAAEERKALRSYRFWLHAQTKAEPGASPSGGPTTSSGNSEISGGPPSVT
jgi:hypothetical protein